MQRYKRNGITLYQDDFRNIPKDTRYHAVITDPPYGIEWVSKQNGHRTRIAGDSITEFGIIRTAMTLAADTLIEGGAAVFFTTGSVPSITAQWIMSMCEAGIPTDDVLIWRKPGLGFGARYRRCYEVILVGHAPGRVRWHGGRSAPNVIEMSRTMPRPGGHPTPKPLALMELLVEQHTSPGEIILDPFAGSGTTLLAAARLGRRAVGIEIEARWCDIAVGRLESYFNAKEEVA